MTVGWVDEVGMDGLELFTTALGLGEPWRVTGAEFAEQEGRLDLHVAYRRGAVCVPGARLRAAAVSGA
ncbi:hypothetical protein [Saccharopolyspora hattusasensis]|uniref:hypothetical protein n=1 Tax=Saccharopolyspora hattusasensis TaxID=1128679 RepID=UPI003D95B078